MAEETNPQVDEKCCLHDANLMETVDETSVVAMPLRDDVLLLPAVLSKGVKLEIKDVNLRRYSTGVLDKRGPGKAQVQTRYRGNQTSSSTHDLCKHGKRREDDVVIKPWKLVKKKNVEGGDLVKVESLSSPMRKSLGNVVKPVQVAKREEEGGDEVVKSCDGLRFKRSESKTSTPPSDSGVVRKIKKTDLDVKRLSRIGSSSTEDVLKNVKNKEKTKIQEPVESENVLEKKVSRISENKSAKDDVLKKLKNKEKTKSDEMVECEDVLEKKVSRMSENKKPVKCVHVLEKKVSRISESKTTKEDLLKNLKTTKSVEPVKHEDATEKTLYVVETSTEEKKKKSIKSVKSETQKSYEKRILRGSGTKIPSLIPSLSPSPSSEEVKESRVTKSDPRPIRQAASRSKTGLSEKKEAGSANLVTDTKTESKIVRPKRIGTKVTPPPKPTMQLYFKKGKALDPKPEGPSPTLLKFKKRVVQEPKLRIDVNKSRKTPKDKGVRKIINGEGKREKVVLRHRKVEAKKKLQTLFNNVIEETVNRLEEVRKSKVKALVGAFETVISLQDDKTKASQKKKNVESESTSPQVVEG